MDQVGQVMDIFHDAVVKQNVLLPQSKLMQTVMLLEVEVGEHLRRAESATSPTFRGCEFQGKINRVLSEPCQSTHGYANESPPELSLTSNFWRLFFNSTNSILPPIQTPNYDDNTIYPPLTRTNQIIPYTTTPFTQKLYHACAKSGHRYLTNPTVTDAQLWPEFGLMLEHLPRQEIIFCFERVLSTSPCNPVLDGRFPFISLGNAGAHFSSGMHNLLPFQATNGVRVVPCEEEWFDVKDVEGYLFEKSIQLVGCYDPALYIGESGLLVPGQVSSGNMVLTLDEATLINGESNKYKVLWRYWLTYLLRTKSSLYLSGVRRWIPAPRCRKLYMAEYKVEFGLTYFKQRMIPDTSHTTYCFLLALSFFNSVKSCL